MLGMGFTELSVELEELVVDGPIIDGSVEEPLIAPLFIPGAVAEVSVDMPVAALGEPAHQSLLARALGEAFI